MSVEFENLEQTLMVEVIRRKQMPLPRLPPDPADEVSEGPLCNEMIFNYEKYLFYYNIFH